MLLNYEKLWNTWKFSFKVKTSPAFSPFSFQSVNETIKLKMKIFMILSLFVGLLCNFALALPFQTSGTISTTYSSADGANSKLSANFFDVQKIF